LGHQTAGENRGHGVRSRILLRGPKRSVHQHHTPTSCNQNAYHAQAVAEQPLQSRSLVCMRSTAYADCREVGNPVNANSTRTFFLRGNMTARRLTFSPLLRSSKSPPISKCSGLPGSLPAGLQAPRGMLKSNGSYGYLYRHTRRNATHNPRNKFPQWIYICDGCKSCAFKLNNSSPLNAAAA